MQPAKCVSGSNGEGLRGRPRGKVPVAIGENLGRGKGGMADSIGYVLNGLSISQDVNCEFGFGHFRPLCSWEARFHKLMVVLGETI